MSMSRFDDGSYGSLTGIALIGKVLAGRCPMRYTRAVVGKGHIPDDQTPKTMPGPADYVMDARIANVTNPVDGECQVVVQLKSDDVEHGFYLTCIVLMAADPDLGEVPYTYISFENEPEWISAASSIVGKLSTFDITVAVGDVDTVHATIDPEAYATVGRLSQEINTHDSDENAHAEKFNNVIRRIGISISEHNSDPNAHSEIISTAVTNVIQEMISGGTLPVGGLLKVIEVTIPKEEWQEDTAATNGYRFFYDLCDELITEELRPEITFTEECLETVSLCGMCPTANSFDGYVRLKCVTRPDASISLACALYGQSAGGGGGGVPLMPATETTLGGIKASSTIHVDSDGKAHAVATQISPEAFASHEEVTAALDEVYG